MTDDPDHSNIAAMAALQKGETDPLIDLLNDTNAALHPDLRRLVADMLIGDNKSCPYWLVAKRHPGFPQSDAWKNAARDMSIGIHIHTLLSDDSGGRPPTVTKAIADACERLNLSESTVRNAWDNYRAAVNRLDAEDDNSDVLSRPATPPRGKRRNTPRPDPLPMRPLPAHKKK